MDIKKLEQALKELIWSNSPRMALSSLAGNGVVQLPAEFSDAARSLSERQAKGTYRGDRGEETQFWS